MSFGSHFFGRPDRRRTSRDRRGRPRRLLVETLEGRRLLATRIWDGGGADDNWMTAANWSTDVVPEDGDTLQFAGSTRLTPYNNFPVNTSFQGIVFNAGAGAFTLTGNPITLTSDVTNNDDDLQTVNLGLSLGVTREFQATPGDISVGGIISGGGGVTKEGPGTLTLSGANVYMGSTRINDGTLLLSGAGKISSAAATVSAGTLDLHGTTQQITTLTLGGGAGTTATVAIGSGELKLGGTVTYTGTSGPSGASITADGGGKLSLMGNRTFSVDDSLGTSSELTISAIIQNGDATARELTKTSPGTLVFSGANNYTGRTTVSAGILRLGASDVIPDGLNVGHLAVNSPGQLDLAGHDETISALTGNGLIDNSEGSGTYTLTVGSSNVNLDFTGSIRNTSGTVNLTKIGTGTQQLQGTNTFTGATLVSGGTLRLTGTTVLHDASKLEVSGDAVCWLDNSETVGEVTLTQGTLTGGTLISTVGFELRSGTVNADLAGDVAVTKTTDGSVLIRHITSYSGLTSVAAGTLIVSENGSLGTAAERTIVANGATLQVNRSITEPLELNGTGVANGGALTGTGTPSPVVSGTVILASNASVGVAAAGDTLTISGQISGSGGLTKVGDGQVTLSNTFPVHPDNNYAGNTVINAGTLYLNAENVIPDGAGAGNVTVAATGTLALTRDESINGLSGSGMIRHAGSVSRTLTVGLNNQTSVFSGSIRDREVPSVVPFGLSKTGTGTLTLSGSSTYTGQTTVTQGVLRVGHANALGAASSSTVINSTGSTTTGGQLQISEGVTLAEPLRIQGTGDAAPWQATILNVSGDNTLTGGITITGTIAARIGAQPGTTLNVGGAIQRSTASGGPLVFDGGAIVVNTALDNNAGTFGIEGGGTVTLNQSGNDIGATAVRGGSTLVLGVDNALPTNQSLTLGAAGPPGTTGKLDLNGHAQTVTPLLEQGDGTSQTLNEVTNSSAVSAGSLTVVVNTTDRLYSGLLTGNLALVKTGSNALTLSGNNTFSGTTTVTQGALVVGHANALGATTSGTSVAAGAQVRLEGGISVAAEPLTLSGTGIASGGALRSASGDNTWSGAIDLAASSTIAAAGSSSLTISGEIRGTAGGASEILTFNMGSGALTVAAISGRTGGVADGAGLTTVLLPNAVTANFNGAIHVSGDVTQSAGTGTTSFGGGGNIGGGLSVTTSAIAVQASPLAVSGAVAFSATSGVAVSAGLSGGSLTIDADSDDNAAGVFSNSAQVSTGGGTIRITASDVDISAAVDATSGGRVILTPSTAVPIGLGAGGTFSLTTAEADLIHAGVLEIDASGMASAVTVGADVNLSGGLQTVATLVIRTGSTVTGTSGTSAITVDSLAIVSADAVMLTDPDNEVGNLAVDAATGDIQFRDATDLAVTTVDGVPGLDTDNGAIDVTTGAGNDTGDLRVSANVDAGTAGAIRLAGTNANDGLTLDSSATIVTASGKISLVYDNMAIASTAMPAIAAGGANAVELHTLHVGTRIDLGSTNANADDNLLRLSDAELDRIRAAGLEIQTASSAADAIGVSAAISLAHARVPALHLKATEGGIRDASGQTAVVTATSLALSAGTEGIGTAAAPLLVDTGNDTLAAIATDGDIYITETDSQTVGSVTVDGETVTGITTVDGGGGGGRIELTLTNGSLTVDAIIQAAGAGQDVEIDVNGALADDDVTLNAPVEAPDQVEIRASRDILQAAADDYVTASGVVLLAGARIGTAAATPLDLQTSTVAATAGTDLFLNQDAAGPGLTIGQLTSGITGGAVTGASTTNGRVDVRTEADPLTVSSPVSAGTAGDVILRAEGGASDVVLSADVEAADDVHIQAGQAITRTAGTVGGDEVFLDAAGAVGASGAAVATAANQLGVRAGGAVDVSEVDTVTVGTVNDLIAGATFAGIVTSHDDVTLQTGGTLTIGEGGGEDIDVGNATVTLDTAAGGVLELADSIVSGSALRLLGAGAFALTQANAVGTLAAQVLGSVNFTDADLLTVGDVSGTEGIATGSGSVDGGDVVVNAGGLLTVARAIDTSPGTGGELWVASGVTLDAGIALGAGDVHLNGGGAACHILVNASQNLAGNAYFRAACDVVVNAAVATTASANVELSGDDEGNGSGGVLVTVLGSLDVAGNLAATGSALTAVNGGGYTGNSVGVANGGATPDVRAAGTIQIGDGVAAPAGADTVVDGQVQGTGAGQAITVTGAQDVRFGIAAGVTGVSGTVAVTADTGAGNDGVIFMADGAVIDAGSGRIDLDAAGSITLGGLLTASVSATAVTIDTGAAVVDGGDTDVDIVAADGTTVIHAAAGIGDGNALETNLETLSAANTGLGNIEITEVAAGGGLGVQGAIHGVADGDIVLTTTDGTLTVLSGGSSVSTLGGGNVTLTANGNGQDVILNASVSAQAGTVSVRAAGGNGSHIQVNGAVSTVGGPIFVRADQDITGSDAGTISSGAGGGDITIHADYDPASVPDDVGTIHLSGDITGGTGNLIFSLTACDGWLGATAGAASGNIRSGNDLTKDGSGTLRLNGNANTYSGTTTVNGGYLLVNGTLTQSVMTVYGTNQGTLGGTGRIDVDSLTVDASGRMDPGEVVDCLPQPGLLTVDGNVTFEPDSTFNIQLNGIVPGTSYDQLRVDGTVDLSGTVDGADGSFLTGTSSGLPVGAELRIIDNDDTDAINTRFDGLKEGDFVTIFAPVMNISYRAGTGNDVVLSTPGRYDFNGYGGHTAPTWSPVSPFQTYPEHAAGWVGALPWYFERYRPDSADWDRLRYDGQCTNGSGDPLYFRVSAVAGKTYEVMILTGDAYWNHDKEQFTVTGSGAGGTTATQTVDVWGAGAPDGTGVKVTWGGGTANPGPGYYRWVRLTVTVGGNADEIGTLTMTMDDLGGGDSAAVILAMDVRPVAAVGRLTVVRDTPQGVPSGTPPKLSVLPADGTTRDKYTGTGAPPYAVLTVTASAGSPAQYANVTPDAVPAADPGAPVILNASNTFVATFGGQIRADELGNFEFWVERPATLTNTSGTPPATVEDWTIVVEESTGLSRGSLIQPYEAPDAEESAPLRFDFGASGSPVQKYGSSLEKSFLPVIPQTLYSPTRGYGWLSRVAASDRRDTTTSALRTDFNSGSNATFKVDLPNGTYNLRMYHSNPLYYGQVPYAAKSFTVSVRGATTTTYTVPVVAPGTTYLMPQPGESLSVTVDRGYLEIFFGAGFMISGMDISSGALPSDSPLAGTGDPRDEGAAAIGVEALAPVVADAVGRWTDIGLTAPQTATLANVHFAVSDLGGSILGLANSATNTIRIDDDAAMIGWAGDRDQVSGVRGQGSGGTGALASDLSPYTSGGVDLLTVVMHELGHLLGYEHSEDADGLMAPVLEAGVAHGLSFPASSAPDLSLDLSASLPRLSAVATSIEWQAGRFEAEDGVYAELGRDGGEQADATGELSATLLESLDESLLAAPMAKASDETGQARVPRRSRLERFERELDAWFAELAAGDAVGNCGFA